MKRYRILENTNGEGFLIQKKKSFMGVVRYKNLINKNTKSDLIFETRSYAEDYVKELKQKTVLNKKRKILDEPEVTINEILQHSIVNFLFGLSGGIVIAFVALFINSTDVKNATLLFAFYFLNKQMESKVLNRNTYISKLGKNYIYPIPNTFGFLLGAWLSTLI